MDKFDRIYQLHAILSNRRTGADAETLMTRLECSRATLFRIIRQMRDYLGAPIELDEAQGGYLYRQSAHEPRYQLPGLWFSVLELQCLAILQRMLAGLAGGLLGDQLAAIQRRLEQLMSHRRLNLGEAAARLRFPTIAARPPGEAFHLVAAATLQRSRLKFDYHSRGNNRQSSRRVSPQRLVHYRDAWYLDAWDEGCTDLRTFALDRIKCPELLREIALDIPEQKLDEHFATGYGIFGGKADKVAVLLFDNERARWVADEEWHPAQCGSFQPDGSYELRIPYRDHRELVMDILRHGPHVKVLEPTDLLEEVKRQLAQAVGRYSSREVSVTI